MVKTTIDLDTEIYEALVEEAVKKYGTTKTLSRLINDKLRSKKSKDGLDIVKKTAGIWRSRESGYEYTRRIRSESEKRLR
jgi:hypothetical protein